MFFPRFLKKFPLCYNFFPFRTRSHIKISKRFYTSYKSVSLAGAIVSCLNGSVPQVFVTIDMQTGNRDSLTGGRKMEKKKDRRIGRALSWILLVLLVMIIVPVGAVMFVISGLWNAADRALLRFNK